MKTDITIYKGRTILYSFLKEKTCLFILFILINSCIGFSQIISTTAKLDRPSIQIGEQIELQLFVKYRVDNGEIKIKWPTINDTIIKQIEIISKSKIDTTIADKTDPYLFTQSQTLIITSFDSGYYAIPPFKFIANNDTNNIKETEALLLQVNTLQIDTTKAIMDIKPPMSEPFQWKELIPYILWGLAILATIVLVAFIAIKFSKKKPIETVEKKLIILPHVTALEALENLRNEKLWQIGKIKQYHSALSDILRNYIEDRFKVNALEQTTDEILYSFRSVVIDEESKNKLKQILILADLVKFAKEQPMSNENEMSLNNAFEFVNGTLREEKKPSSNLQEAENIVHNKE